MRCDEELIYNFCFFIIMSFELCSFAGILIVIGCVIIGLWFVAETVTASFVIAKFYSTGNYTISGTGAYLVTTTSYFFLVIVLLCFIVGIIYGFIDWIQSNQTSTIGNDIEPSPINSNTEPIPTATMYEIGECNTPNPYDA